MLNASIESVVKEQISNMMLIDVENIGVHYDLIDDLHISIFEKSSIIVCIETECLIDISDLEAMQVSTVADLIRLVDSKVNKGLV